MDSKEQGRYDQAVALFNEGGWAYEARTATREEVTDLAGVSAPSVIPRFFTADPEANGFVSAPKTNNGGLRWLKDFLSANTPKQQPEPEPVQGEEGPGEVTEFTPEPTPTPEAAPQQHPPTGAQPQGQGATVTIEPFSTDGKVTEGAPAYFELTRTGDTTHPLTVNLLVFDSGLPRVPRTGTSWSRRYQTVTFPAGQGSVFKFFPTLHDNDPELDRPIQVRVLGGPGYTAGTPSYAEVLIVDDDPVGISVSVEARASSLRESSDPPHCPFSVGRSRSGNTAWTNAAAPLLGYGELTVEFELTETGNMLTSNPVTSDGGLPPEAMKHACLDLDGILVNDNVKEPHSTVTATIKTVTGAENAEYEISSTLPSASIYVRDDDWDK